MCLSGVCGCAGICLYAVGIADKRVTRAANVIRRRLRFTRDDPLAATRATRANSRDSRRLAQTRADPRDSAQPARDSRSSGAVSCRVAISTRPKASRQLQLLPWANT